MLRDHPAGHETHPRAAQVLAEARVEIIAGGAAQQAARLVIRRVLERERRRDRGQASLVRASLTARDGHDVGGPRRRRNRLRPERALDVGADDPSRRDRA